MNILTLNCGSSSVKFQLYDWGKKMIMALGMVDRIGIDGSSIKHTGLEGKKVKKEFACPNHKRAIEEIISYLLDEEVGPINDIKSINAVGHRVVHGGERFAHSVIINNDALNTFRELSDLAPLHNPPNITGIEAALSVLPGVPHCAVMDTAWHQTMPRSSFLYALPYKWYGNYSVRRYGFHGTSFLYVSKRAAVLLGKDPFRTNLIALHIGNGVSVNAVLNGCSLDTSMGMTPLEGLVMGTRAGDHDPAIGYHLMRKENLEPDEVERILNKQSGILGITERFSDRRDVIEAADKGDERCRLAIEIETYRLKKYIGAYYAALGKVDAIVFTAGAGEMGSLLREKAVEGLEEMGIRIDRDKNNLSQTRNAETDITGKDSKVKILVIPTDEELVMTEDTYALLKGIYDVHTNFTYSFQGRGYRNVGRERELEKEISANPGLASIVMRPA
ncbi:MAG: acetate kinase [Spirochaetales bacterium]|nr:acetate kinase [Spirochaetales bacterium]